MSTLLRSLQGHIERDLRQKMVFLGGPRQVGKTTFAQGLIPQYRDGHPAYLNWDLSEDRRRILKGDWPANQRLIVLDEIHKYSKWRNLIKGYYDKLKNTHRFLVTGSARLDVYRRGGDSLLGRYHYYRMHPLSLPEVSKELSSKELERLIEFGGFPEPYLKRDRVELKRWHRGRRERIVQTDIRDLESIKDLTNIEILMDALPDRVGSPLSRKSLAEDLAVDFKTIERWITILENVYYCYRIPPYGAPKIRAVKKEQKLYLWDWSELHVSDGPELERKGVVWENFVAGQLLKYCHFIEDTEGAKMELRFLRDFDGREVDFVVLRDKRPIFAVECKAGERSVSPSLQYFVDRTPIPIFYQVHAGRSSRAVSDKIKLLPFADFCRETGMV